MQFDLDGLVLSTRSLVILPAALGLFLLFMGLPVFLFYRVSSNPTGAGPSPSSPAPGSR